MEGYKIYYSSRNKKLGLFFILPKETFIEKKEYIEEFLILKNAQYPELEFYIDLYSEGENRKAEKITIPYLKSCFIYDSYHNEYRYKLNEKRGEGK